MHKLQQKQLPMLLLAAGLPVLPGLAGELSREDAYKAIRDPALAVSVDFEQGALEKIYEHTKGHPYFLQEWGYKAWNLVDVIDQLDHNFFRVRFDRLTPKERDLLEKGRIKWLILPINLIQKCLL